MVRASARKLARAFSITFALWGAAQGGVRAAAKDPAAVLATSPSGELRIESPDLADDKVEEWVVSTADPKLRARLGEKRVAEPGDYTFSPDERWIAATFHLGHGMADAELYRQKEGVKFADVLDHASLGQSLWQFYDRTTGRKAPADAAREDKERGIVDFIAWSPDAARALFALRGGEKRGAGIYHWGAYYNVRRGQWELSEYLRAFNSRAAKRWSGDFDADPAFDLLAAESVDPLPDEAALQARLDKGDHELNRLYQQILKAEPEAGKARLRQNQREWIGRRDRGAKAFAQFGPGDEAARRRIQYLTDATRAQAEEFRRNLNSAQ